MHLRILLASPAGSSNEVLEGCLGLLPSTGLQAAIRVNEQQLRPDEGQELGDAILDLLLAGYAGRVDIIDTGPNLVRVAKLLESIE
jgi:hypothetical protein